MSAATAEIDRMRQIDRVNRRLITHRIVRYLREHGNQVVSIEDIANELETRPANLAGVISYLARKYPVHAVVKQVPEVRGFYYWADEPLSVTEIESQLVKFYD